MVLPVDAILILKQWREKYPRPETPAIGGDDNDNAGQGEGQDQGKDGDGAAIGASSGEGKSGNPATTVVEAGACVASG